MTGGCGVGSPRLLDADGIGARRAAGLWGDETLAEIVDRHAALRPDHLAVIDAQARMSYADLVAHSHRLAAALVDVGVEPGDRVAARLPGSILLPALHLACVRIGALFLPLSPAWASSELRALVAGARASVLVLDDTDEATDTPALSAALRRDLPDLREVLPARSGADGTLEIRAAGLAPLGEAELARRRPDPGAPALVMSSSGTTAAPKAAVWGGNDLVALLVHNVAPRLGITPDDVAAGLAPAGTGSTGYVFPVLAPLLVGATSALLERWSPQAALDLMVTEGATYATAIPTQMTMLLPLDLEAADLGRLTRFNNAGAPLPAEVAREIEERIGCRVQSIYGSTDGGVPVMTGVTDPDDARRTTVGSVCRGVELMLVDADGGRVAAGEPGEVCWRGSKSWGHLDQPENDRASFDGAGWYHSGDVGVFDASERLRIVGRIKDMILRGGTNIFPAEIEDLLARHPDVDAVAVVGTPDARLGERACAVVVPRTGRTPTLDGLCAFLRAREIAVQKLPEDLVVVDELPINVGGKIDKAALRAVVSRRPPTSAGGPSTAPSVAAAPRPDDTGGPC